MPIILDNLQQNVTVKTFSPKFFSDKLTGVGKKVGVLNQENNPVNINVKKQRTLPENIYTKKQSFYNGKNDVSAIPLYVIGPDAERLISKHIFSAPDSHKLADFDTGNIKGELYGTMEVHSLIFEELYQGEGVATKKVLTPSYHLRFFFIINSAVNECYQISKNSTVEQAARQNLGRNTYFDVYTCNPRTDIDYIINTANCNITPTADYDDLVNLYSLYNGCAKRSEEWQTSIDKTLDVLFTQTATINNPINANKDELNLIAYVIRHLEDYNVPLDLYKNIYNSIQKNYDPDHARVFCKENLNLLLSYTLNNLNDNKTSLVQLPTPATPPVLPARYSREQVSAITSTEPLVLVQAGAGTGKSTVILGRIDYMIACGVDPADITVLSFTNAAANNITNRNPNVHSMTIARMIHNIYSNNFTDHELSSIDTIINSIDIYFPDDDFAQRFRGKLRAIVKNDRDAFTSMNNFIERNYDAVIGVLNTIKQTSLELEIIICYQQIENFSEPKDVQSKYLIIDEVQDNSIFEFIYMLKYTEKHKESLFIVGDCSQTLYEFRASNPKALNVLEGSGVFATYQLQVNYRSNQEILDFANVTLKNIEANQYANIQLQANSLTKVTEKSFKEKVKLQYHQLNKIRDFADALPSIFAVDVRKFIDEKLALGEKVAFLAHTRNNVYQMKDILESMYPNKSIANLVPDKMYNDTIFSQFIKEFWAEVQYTPSVNIMTTIMRTIIDKLDRLVYSAQKSLPRVKQMLASWNNQNGFVIANWQNQFVKGLITQEEFLEYVRDNMLQFEIKNNAIKQALLSARNEENKKSDIVKNADLILSTIHSAKGLEFDNTVVIYQNTNDMAEDKKRMYYVAFTRAMKAEYIVAFDTVVSPKIESDYEEICKTLAIKDKAVAMANHSGQSVNVITGVDASGNLQSVTFSPTETENTSMQPLSEEDIEEAFAEGGDEE